MTDDLKAKAFSEEELKFKRENQYLVGGSIGNFTEERFLDTIAARDKRIKEVKKQAEIKDSLAEGVMTLVEVHEQLEDAKKRIEELEEYAEELRGEFTDQSATIERLEGELYGRVKASWHICEDGEMTSMPSKICSRSPKCGNDFNPRDRIADQTAVIERLEGLIRSWKDGFEKAPVVELDVANKIYQISAELIEDLIEQARKALGKE